MVHVLITREAGRGEDLRRALEGLGHRVTHVPLIATEPLGDEPLALDPYEWVIVTSVTGARELRRRATGHRPRYAAIGEATAEALGGADFIPAVASQEGFLAEFPPATGRVLFAGAEGARRLIAETLGADFVALYRTIELTPADLPDADLAVLASPSAARALARVRPGAAVVSIGPQTTQRAAALGLAVLAEATYPNAAAVAVAVEDAVSAL
ncbi:MAG: uroporphyrinogen-III synthase [Gaiella sp.]